MSVGLVLRAVQLQASTSGGDVGTVVRLEPGLNVLRADNSSGKSTVLQAIIYALGLEGMLSARRDIPLPHSMTDHVDVGDAKYAVERSWVRLELQNASGHVITIERHVKSRSIDRGLVQVWHGPMISGLGDYTKSDYFVRRAGAAVREAGFHHYLAEFAGWRLPSVTHMDGSERPLYLESLFPYFYVEQKHGWSGVQARLPTYLGIRDVGKRSAEYVLGLEYFQRVLERQRLTAAASEIQSAWDQAVDELRGAVQAAGLVLTPGPARPTIELADVDYRPRLHTGEEWLELDAALAARQAEVRRLQARPIATVGERSVELEQQLAAASARFDLENAAYQSLLEEQRVVLARRDQVELRIDSLEEDLQKHKDSITLSNMGADQSIQLIAQHVCPTCHQHLSDGSDIAAHVMTAAESVDFISEQLNTFRGMSADLDRVVSAVAARLIAMRARLSDERSAIRSLKDALMASNATPSIADVSALALAQNRLEALILQRENILRARDLLSSLAAQWRANRELLGRLSTEGLSPRDSRVLDAVEASLRAQLRRYGFSSLSPDEVEINRETYRPANEGFDLGFDISASDMIRVIWAYLMSLLEVSRSFDGNHAGFLIFDEPRQQETAKESYEALLRQAADAGAAGVQILFATSEPSLGLRAMLSGAAYSLIDIPSQTKLLQAL